MFCAKNILYSAPRVSGLGILTPRNINTAAGPLCFKMTQLLQSDQLKKKKRIDPQVLRQREERKRKRIEKAIKFLEKKGSQLKPIDELELPRNIRQEIDIRKRPEVAISEEVEDQRVALQKQWSAYMYNQHREEVTMFDRAAAARERALEELRQESEELWLEAVQIDPTLLPYRAKGPTLTPPIPDYPSPDGEYINVSKVWE